VRLPFGVEVFSDDLRALSPLEASRTVAQAIYDVMPAGAKAAAGESTGHS